MNQLNNAQNQDSAAWGEENQDHRLSSTLSHPSGSTASRTEEYQPVGIFNSDASGLCSQLGGSIAGGIGSQLIEHINDQLAELCERRVKALKRLDEYAEKIAKLSERRDAIKSLIERQE